MVHEVLKRGFFPCPSLFFGFIEVVDQVADEIEKACVVEPFPKSFDDSFTGEFWVHTW